MKKKSIEMKFAAVLIILLMATGCAYTPQTVSIQPTVQLTPSNIGNGRNVSLYVVDERTSTEIGRRGTGMMQGAAITIEGDIATTFANTISQNLELMGFKTNRVNNSTPVQGASLLRVDIRSIDYETSQGFWTGGVHVSGSLKSTATRGAQSYDQTYRINEEKRVMVVPGANENEQMINATVSALLQEMFNDTQLFKFLSE